MLRLRLIFLLGLLALALTYHVARRGTWQANPYGEPSPDNEVILYALRDDGHSALKRSQLSKQQVDFREVYPLENKQLYGELGQRLLDEGFDFEGKALLYHLPIVEVNGELVTSPEIERVWEELRYR